MKQGDITALLMFNEWTKHGTKPSEIYNMPKGELNLIKAFYIIEMEKVNELLKGR